MSFNIIDIKVVADYTDFSNSVRFQLNVPVTATEATAITKSLTDGTWSEVEAGITKAVNAGAPTPIQTLVAALMKAYSGAAPAPDPAPAPAPDPDKPAT